MSVDLAGETVMTIGIFRDTSRTKVFGGEHTSSGHDSDQRVELGLLRVLVIS